MNLVKAEEKNNYLIMLKVTKVIGSSTLLSMALNMLRMKVAAILLGPAGVGFIGLLQSFVLLASSIISAGLNQSAIRQVAEAVASEDENKRISMQNAINSLTIILVVLGVTFLFLLQDLIEPHFVVTNQYSFNYGWLILSIVLVTLSGVFTAQLNGYRKIRDIASINIFSALFSLVLGVLGLILFSEYGFLIFFVSFFLVRFLFVGFFLKNIYIHSYAGSSLKSFIIEYRSLLKLGSAMMLGGLAWNFAHLFVKKLIEKDIGLSEVGIFEAGWTLGTVYLGFLLASIGADYLPRLTSVINDREKSIDIINHQTEMIFLFVGPIIIFAIGFSPWIVIIAYSSEFSRASDLLRWFIVGDVLKLLTWPLTYAIIAAGYPRYFLFIELISVIIYVFIVYLFLNSLGASAAGLSILFIYLTTLPLCFLKLRKRFSFQWSRLSIKLFIIIFLCTLFIFLIGELSYIFAAVFSILLAAIFAIYSFVNLCERTGRRDILLHFSKYKFW